MHLVFELAVMKFLVGSKCLAVFMISLTGAVLMKNLHYLEVFWVNLVEVQVDQDSQSFLLS